jgi:hypothetical protein
MNIKIDEFISKGRPIFMRELNIMSPGPDVYEPQRSP